MRALFLLTILLALPRSARAQTLGTGIAGSLDSLDAGTVAARADALSALSDVIDQVPPEGRTKLIMLLDRELRGQMPIPDVADAEGDPELYAEYIAGLTRMVASFNDPRATPLLARQGIAFISTAVFQVAVAGDAGIGPLVATWDENDAMRPAVLETMGQMWHYADSTARPLAASTRAAIAAHMLLASEDAVPWIRRAYTRAVGFAGDPLYLPVLRQIAAQDTATLNGRRYVAAGAAEVVPALERRAAQLAPVVLVRSAVDGVAGACAAGWIDEPGICTSLTAKLDAAAAALDRGNASPARGQLQAARRELDAQRDTHVRESAYELLAGYLDIVLARL